MAFIEATGIAQVLQRCATARVRPVLRDVSLSVERGEFTSIVGAMGSGKSTLLSILAGLTDADSGTVTVDGEPVRGVRADAAFVFQNYSLLPWFTRARERPPGSGGGLSDARPRRAAGARPRALEQVGLAERPQPAARSAVGRHAPAGCDRARLRDRP